MLTLVGLAALLVTGCSSTAGGPELTKDEMDKLKNPSKEIPPQLAETMKRAQEDAQKKMNAQTKGGS